MIIKPDKFEVATAKWVADERDKYAQQIGAKHKLTEQIDKQSFYGALSEIAVCKALNKYFWHSIGTTGGVDIQPNIQVRTSKHKPAHLNVYLDDDPNHKFIFVRILERELELVGWMWGFEAKNEQYRRTPGDGKFPAVRDEAFWVPEEHLDPNVRFLA